MTILRREFEKGQTCSVIEKKLRGLTGLHCSLPQHEHQTRLLGSVVRDYIVHTRHNEDEVAERGCVPGPLECSDRGSGLYRSSSFFSSTSLSASSSGSVSLFIFQFTDT